MYRQYVAFLCCNDLMADHTKGRPQRLYQARCELSTHWACGGRRVYTDEVKESRQSFLLHLRYNFHNPPLGPRDYTAIEHQVSLQADHLQR